MGCTISSPSSDFSKKQAIALLSFVAVDYISRCPRVNQTVVYEIGVLRTRACFNGPCVTDDTPSIEDCDKAGKAAASFVILGLLTCVVSLLMVFFSSLRKGFLSMSFLTTAIFYAIAITTWAEGCHADLEGSLNARLSAVGSQPFGVTFEYGIGFGAILSAMTASLLSILFMCCTPDE